MGMDTRPHAPMTALPLVARMSICSGTMQSVPINRRAFSDSTRDTSLVVNEAMAGLPFGVFTTKFIDTKAYRSVECFSVPMPRTWIGEAQFTSAHHEIHNAFPTTSCTAITAIIMEFNEEHIEAPLKDLTPSPSPWQAEVITIEDDAAPADPITIDHDTESGCDLQQKEFNLEDIEEIEVEKDDSDSEDEGSLGQPALPQEQTFASLGALESYLHDFAVPLGFDVDRSKWYGKENKASGKKYKLYFRCCRGRKQDSRHKADSRRHTIKTDCKWKVTAVASEPSDLTRPIRTPSSPDHNS
ncbi:hypothetical protein E4U52_007806 [Claviceps spartinae]|nr:hypothetical protein E4U52_007806 [Claviceps spartinae]